MKKFMILLIAIIPLLLISCVEFATVVVKDAYYIAVEQVVFPQEYQEIVKLDSKDVEISFAAQVYPLQATDKEIKYVSSNQNIAKVDKNGNIKFFDFGEVEISAQSLSNTSVITKCKFYVTDTKVHRIELVDNKNTLDVGDNFFVKSKIIPIEAIDKTLTYSSSNSAVAEVLPTGKITALAKGFTTITVTAANGVNTSFELEVTVPVSDIKIDESHKHIVTGNAEGFAPDFTIYPNNATNKNVNYISCDESIATISSTGKFLFAQSGTCTFKIVTQDRAFEDTFEVLYTGGYILSAQIDNQSQNIIKDYQENLYVDIVTNIYPQDANIKNVIYTSLNNSVIRVESDGKLSVVGGGRAEVKVSIKKDANTVVDIGICNVYIKRACQQIIVASKNVTTNVPEYKIDYTCLPNDHTDTIEFAVSSIYTATVLNSGLVVFNGHGQVTVNIKANGTVKESIQITYVPKDTQLLKVVENKQKVECYYGDSFVLAFADDLNIDITNISYTIFGPSFVYDTVKDIFYTIQGGETILYVSSGETTLEISIKVIRYATDIEYTYDTLQTTSKKVVNFASQVLPQDSTTENVTYETSNENIATIDNNGTLTFLKAGSVDVVIKADSVVKTVTITSTFGFVTDFTLAYNYQILEDIGETFVISNTDFSFIPSDYTFDITSATISLQNAELANVNQNNITALAKGATKVFVTIDGIQKSFDIEIQVKTKNVYFVYKDTTITDGKVYGKTIDLDYRVAPANANNKNVIFAVVEGDATIDAQTGILTFNNENTNTVVISITTLDSNVTKTIALNKVNNIESLEIYLEDENVTNASYTTISSLQILPEQVLPTFEIRAGGVIDADIIDLSNVVTSKTDDNTSVDCVGMGLYRVSNSNHKKSTEETITFSINEIISSVQVKFYKLERITMTLDNADDSSFGLQRKRVFGTSSYVNGQEQTYMPIDYSLSQNGAEDEVYFFISCENKTNIAHLVPDLNFDTDLFYIQKDASGVYNIHSNITDIERVFTMFDYEMSYNGMLIVDLELQMKVIIGNEPVYELCTVTDQYIYHFVSAMNIYDADGYNSDYYKNKVLQTNFVIDPNEVAGDNYVLLQPNIITHSDGKKKLQPIVGDSKYNFAMALYGNGYILNLNGITDTSAEFLEVYKHFSNLRLKLEKDNAMDSYTRHIATYNATISYSIIENMANIYAGPSVFLSVTHCVIRNANKCGILIGSGDNYGDFTLYVENCIFSNVGQCAINAQNGTIIIRGFFDVYNFVSYNNFTEYSSLVKELLEAPEYDAYVYKDGSMPLANIAITAPPTSYSSTSSPKVNDVYFLDPATGGYLANIDYSTGYNYQKISQTKSFNFIIYKYNLTAHLWIAPKNNIITPDSPVDLSKVYRKI